MTRQHTRLMTVALAAAALLTTIAGVHAQIRPIDVEHSKLTVLVNKSGLFSALADNHVVSAALANGSISEEPPLSIDLTIRSADLRVIDPGLSSGRRAEVQARMLGTEVLDVSRFPEITFASTSIEPVGVDHWNVTGRLTIHGHTGVINFSVALLNGQYRGEVSIKQRDFGIEPIKIAGGTVKVKDELKIQFEIAK